MAISQDTKDRPHSERISLCRLRPGRHVSNDLASIGGNDYQMTFPFAHVTRVERNGIALTLQNTLSSNDQYTWDESTRELTIRVAAAPDDETNVIVVFYHMFLTNVRSRILPVDPSAAVSASNQEVTWIGALVAPVRAGRAIRNVTAGVITIEPTRVNFKDTEDISFAEHTTLEDSWGNKEVVVWNYVDGEVEFAYRGQSTGHRYKNGRVELQVEDTFSRLRQPATMGDLPGEAYFNRESGSFPSMHPQKSGTPVRMHFGIRSAYEDAAFKSFLINLPVYKNSGVCTDFTQDLSGTNNREWGLCRIPSGSSLATRTFGSLSAATVVSSIFWTGTATGHNYLPGDSFKVEEGGETFYVYVLQTSATGSDNIVGVINTEVGGSGTQIGNVDENSSYTHNSAPAVQIMRSGGAGDHPHFLAYERDFTYSESTTSAGHEYVSITLVDDIEDELWNFTGDPLDSFSNPVNPSVHDLRYRVALTGNISHAEVMKDLVEAAGMSTNASAFTQADTDLVADVAFSIPNTGQDDYKPYLDYCQTLAKSALAFLTLNDDFEVVYKVLAAPSGTAVRDRRLYPVGGIEKDTEYRDIKTAIVALNPDLQNEEIIDDASGPSLTQSSNRLKYLHGVDETETFKHVLSRIDNRIAAHLEVRGTRRARYTWQTAVEDIDTQPGDELTLEDSRITPGGVDDVDIVVTSVKGSASLTQVQGEDLGELT